jgi:hypothetical protein
MFEFEIDLEQLVFENCKTHFVICQHMTGSHHIEADWAAFRSLRFLSG